MIEKHNLTGVPEIVEIKQTCEACPSQWELKLSDGDAGYVRYRGAKLYVGFGDTMDAAVHAGLRGDYWTLSDEPLDGSIEWEAAYRYVLARLISYVAQRSRKPVHVLAAPELTLPWDQVVTYDVEEGKNWKPSVFWITRRVQLHDASIKRRVHGPFEGAAGGAVARTIANGLNHYTRKVDIWPHLTQEERDYITERKDREVQGYELDDEIPF